MNRLATIFSIVTTVGILIAAIFGVVWIIAALRQRETMAKSLCIAGIVIAAAGFGLFLRNYDSSLHLEPDAQAPTTQAVGPEQPQEPAQGPVSAPLESPNEITPAGPQELTVPPLEHIQAEEAENPLATLGIQEHPVMNGFKTERIGTWASITTTKEFMSAVTDQQLYDYLTDLPVSNYNWFNVFLRMEPVYGPFPQCLSSMVKPTRRKAALWSISAMQKPVPSRLMMVIIKQRNRYPSILGKQASTAFAFVLACFLYHLWSITQ